MKTSQKFCVQDIRIKINLSETNSIGTIFGVSYHEVWLSVVQEIWIPQSYSLLENAFLFTCNSNCNVNTFYCKIDVSFERCGIKVKLEIKAY